MNVSYLDNFDIHGINLKEHLDLVTNPKGCMKAVREAIEWLLTLTGQWPGLVDRFRTADV